MTIAIAFPDDQKSDDIMAHFEVEFRDMPSEEIYEAIRDGLRRTVHSWVRMAVAFKILETRGELIERIRSLVSVHLIDWLKRIADGNLRAELICRYHQNAELIRRLGTLPSSEQLRLASGGKLPVMVPDGAGGYTTRMMAPDEMTPAHVKQVFDYKKGHVRTEVEQLAWLDERREESARPLPEKVGQFNIDHETGVVTFTGRRGDVIDPSTFHAILSILRKRMRLAE